MTRVDLEAAELMLDEATPGPWHANRHGEVCFTLPSGLSFAIADVYGDAGPDRDLIVAAPTLIRALIEEVRGLREAMPTDEERIAIGNRLRHDYDRRYRCR